MWMKQFLHTIIQQVKHLLVLSQALYLGEHLKLSLFCPNQMRSFDFVVGNVSNHLLVRYELTHSIYILDLGLRIPMEMKGFNFLD